MSDALNLNFEVTDQILQSIEPKDLIDAIIKATDAYKMNDVLEYISRTMEIALTSDVQKELSTYKGDDGN